MRKSKSIKYTILLVCEGENTEPKYFESIRAIIHNQELWGNDFSLEIIPKPKDEIEDIAIAEKQPNHKSKRRLREVKNTTIRIASEVEKEYSPQPVRFVREAQLAMKDNTYNEAWAIFDNDTRPEHHIKAAFELAEKEHEGIVQIAYSSRAFEHWLLLHFEQNATAFQKSECREGKINFNCSSGFHINDCAGSKCIGGYLRTKKYLHSSTKNNISLFPQLHPRLEIAYINAAWLRFQMYQATTNTRHYNLVPYVTVDKLVMRLLKHDTEYLWANLNENILKDGYSIVANIKGNTLYIHNTGDAHVLFNEGDIKLLNLNYETVYLSPRLEIGSDCFGAIPLTDEQNLNTNVLNLLINNTSIFINL